MLSLYVDYRLGGSPKYYLAKTEKEHMVIPDEIRKSVVFIYYNSGGGFVLAGTAFFMSVEIATGRHLSYLVTARHVIDQIQNKVTINPETKTKEVFIRLNLVGEGTQVVSVDINNWRFHPDSSIDVSILAWSPLQSIYDFLSIPTDMVVTEKIIKEEKIGIGDEVFSVGLFYMHSGKSKNLPILRSGNIALMPIEKVHTEDLGDIDAYLIEARSIGGLSGSPVFVYLGNMRPKNGNIEIGGKHKIFYLLGLMHGHWNIDGDRIDFKINNKDELNTGIAVVVPALKILEFINSDEELLKYRKNWEEKIKEKDTTVADSKK